MSLIIYDADTGEASQTLAPEAGTYDNFYESLIFIGVQWNGDDFFFLNAPAKRFGFKWDRWKKFKKVLEPMTFHCFKVRGYRTGTSSGHGFTPVEHICEFAGIKHARLFNRMYLERWQQFTNEDEKTITAETNDFCARVQDFNNVVIPAYFNLIAEDAELAFANETTKADLAFVLSVNDVPNPRYEDIVDTGDIVRMYEQYLLDLAE